MWSINGPDGAVFFSEDDDGYVVRAWGQQVSAEGSPLVVAVDPPIGPASSINFGTLYQQLMAMLNGQ